LKSSQAVKRLLIFQETITWKNILVQDLFCESGKIRISAVAPGSEIAFLLFFSPPL